MPALRLRPLFGLLLCLLLTVDAVAATAAAVRSLGGSCAHARSGDAVAMPAHPHAATGAAAKADEADAQHTAVAHPARHTANAAHRVAAAASVEAGDTRAPTPHAGHGVAGHPDRSLDTADDHPCTPPPGDSGCNCDDGACTCPAACALVLAFPAYPTLGARAPGDITAGLHQHARPAPPQPDTLRPPIG